MAKTYHLCGSAVQELIDDVMRDHHALLRQLEVTVQAVFVEDLDENEEPQPALKVHGVQAAAKIQVTPLTDRVRGIADAKMTICLYTWDRLNGASRLALIDHELEHLAPVENKKAGGWKRDDHGRPKLRLMPHDYDLSGFISIVKRHGESAIEAQELQRFKAEQLPLFPAGLASVL